MSKQPYENSASQSVRRAVTANDRRVAEGMTYHQLTVGEADLVQGRFASVSKTQVTGATQQYPQLPETSPWHHDPVPIEPPLGFSVDEQIPVGEAHEIASSARGCLLPTAPDINNDIAVAALTVEPTKACGRLVAGLLDTLNNLQALLDDER